MHKRELDIEQAHELRVRLNDFENALTGERFLPQLGSDVLQNGGVGVVVLVEQVLER